jgi:putative RNA 2'-phosphotransferase
MPGGQPAARFFVWLRWLGWLNALWQRLGSVQSGFAWESKPHKGCKRKRLAIAKPKFTDISRAILHALRHEPWVYELELDANGWTPVDALLAALHEKIGVWRDITTADFAMINAQSEKKRFELDGSRIRALYGHSIPQKLDHTAAEPPAGLYHGTSPEAAQIILREGLRPMRRQ